jgi:hypothetical protein
MSESVQTAVTNFVEKVETDVVMDVKKVVSEVLIATKDEVTTHTDSFTCCFIPWSLRISHTPTPSSQSTSTASS